ncbi:winged helix DNA-binding protein [Allosaccharopolyspora coralli]|uniref:Winged helix DNA-binding protein n=1 Tax=Allosaccharopolyspora coralli TaxID=2665642 RepID=A0A5Q3Q6C1_9PSEU|nr:MarR family transcriptional regulator [Allosaccharopolyspora coralli]QGK70148.1 winged helix DNA-binding protein [Allosaccharopolyspora coralli]
MSANRPLAEDLGFLLSRASGVLARSASEALAPLGLRVRSYSLLDLAGEDEHGVTQRRLAATMGLDPSQIVSLVDDLERRGLVMRAADPTDRRNKLIVTTEAGQRVRQDARARIAEAEGEPLQELAPPDLDRLRGLLRQIAFPGQAAATRSASH